MKLAYYIVYAIKKCSSCELSIQTPYDFSQDSYFEILIKYGTTFPAQGMNSLVGSKEISRVQCKTIVTPSF